MNDMEALAAAADLLRRNARAAVDHDDERWMVDQTETDGLAVGCYVPEDVLDDGQVCTASVAFFAYPDDQERRTHHAGCNIYGSAVTERCREVRGG